MAKKIFSQLRRAYHTGGLTSNARNIFLKDTDSAEAKILGFVDTVEFITSSREVLNYKIMRGNDCIESVVKSGNRFLTAHESGNDYVQEYVIQLKTPSKLAELISDGQSVQSATYRAVVHVHYNGTDKTLKPTACHFKTWDQRGSTNRNSDERVHYGRLDNHSATAAEPIGELDAEVEKAPKQQDAAKSVGGGPSEANAPQRKNGKARKGKRI